MKTLSLSIGTTAAELIQQVLAQSSVANPTVLLIRQDRPKSVHPEWGKAFFAGADERTLTELFRRLHGKSDEPKDWKIVPAVFPRENFPADSLIAVGEMTFAFWPALAERVDGGTLDLEGSGLVLRDVNGKPVDLFPDDRVT